MRNSAMKPANAQQAHSPWSLYDELVAGVPAGITVRDYAFGSKWSLVEAECGAGVSYAVRGGAKRGSRDNFRGRPLRDLAALAKSWCFEDASLGVAALNAWYSNKERLAACASLSTSYEVRGRARTAAGGMCGRMDGFTQLMPEIQAHGQAKVAVVGHFPRVERLADSACLTVLERQVRDALDTPDSACEYILPDQDYVFMTGTTLINKTMPRLLALSARAKVCVLGPSVVPADALFERGADLLATSVVADPEQARWAVVGGAYQSFNGSLERCLVTRVEQR